MSKKTAFASPLAVACESYRAAFRTDLMEIDAVECTRQIELESLNARLLEQCLLLARDETIGSVKHAGAVEYLFGNSKQGQKPLAEYGVVYNDINEAIREMVKGEKGSRYISKATATAIRNARTVAKFICDASIADRVEAAKLTFNKVKTAVQSGRDPLAELGSKSKRTKKAKAADRPSVITQKQVVAWMEANLLATMTIVERMMVARKQAIMASTIHSLAEQIRERKIA